MGWPNINSAGDLPVADLGVFLNVSNPLMALALSKMPLLDKFALMIFFISLTLISAIPFDLDM